VDCTSSVTSGQRFTAKSILNLAGLLEVAKYRGILLLLVKSVAPAERKSSPVI
jgi:hypothetical protein